MEAVGGQRLLAAAAVGEGSSVVGLTDEPIYRSRELVIHYLITAALCLSSYFSGVSVSRPVSSLLQSFTLTLT